jgi:hypothetical protein
VVGCGKEGGGGGGQACEWCKAWRAGRGGGRVAGIRVSTVDRFEGRGRERMGLPACCALF